MPPLQTGNMEKEEIIALVRNPELLNHDTLPRLKELVNRSPMFQSGWFLLLKNLRNINSPEFADYLKKAAPRIGDRKYLFQFLNPGLIPVPPAKSGRRHKHKDLNPEIDLSELTDTVDSGQPKSLQAEMIDDFLKKQPSLRINSTIDPDNIVDISEQSVTEHEDFLTETLAEIYFRQNNIRKAIESFEKLSLKYPEKSIYFAARIEEIKNLLNNK